MRTEPNSIFGNSAQRLQAHHLKTAAVGQDRVRPRHEAMQPARLTNQFVAGTQIEMIGISQQDLHAQRFEFILRHALHRAAGADGHENGRLDYAVRSVQQSRTRAGRLVFSKDFKLDRHEVCGLQTCADSRCSADLFCRSAVLPCP